MAQLDYLNTYRRRPMPVADLQGGGGFTREQIQRTANLMNKAEDTSFRTDMAVNQTAMDNLMKIRQDRQATQDAMPIDQTVNRMSMRVAEQVKGQNQTRYDNDLTRMQNRFGVPGNTKERNQMLIDEGQGRTMTPMQQAEHQRRMVVAGQPPVAPPMPVSFGDGGGAMPDGKGGWTHQAGQSKG